MANGFALLLGPSLLSALLALCARPYRVWVGAANAALSLVSFRASGRKNRSFDPSGDDLAG